MICYYTHIIYYNFLIFRVVRFSNIKSKARFSLAPRLTVKQFSEKHEKFRPSVSGTSAHSSFARCFRRRIACGGVRQPSMSTTLRTSHRCTLTISTAAKDCIIIIYCITTESTTNALVSYYIKRLCCSLFLLIIYL